jgi:hypothetical protein
MDQVTCRHFSIANPRAGRPDDLPALLRRLADAIEAEGIAAVDVLDVTIIQETTADGPWWSGTVYWKPEHEPASAE